MHCVGRQLTFPQLIAALKTELGLESRPPPKWPFLNVFSKIYRLNKMDMLGTQQDKVLFKKAYIFLLHTVLP